MTVNRQIKHELPAFPVTPLLDQIQLRHGPVAQLGRFFLLADQAAHDRGIHLQLHTDMASLDVAYRAVQPGQSVPIVPTFDPAHNDLSPANSFWISGHDDSGMVVATQAARFFDLTQSSVEQELRSLRLFWAEPERHLAAGTHCLVDCPPASGITGRVVYSGGAWYHSKVRGVGLSRILPRISRALAYSQWDSEYTFSVAETVLIEKNVHRSYGYTRHSPSIRLAGSYREDLELELMWMPRHEMLEDLTAYVDAAVENEVRNTETVETNMALPRRHGNSSRS
jgi:hypothetical protein